MLTFVIIIHSIVCVLLVLAILMQAGRGGGLTEQFSSAESVFGAQTSSFMVRLTSILATIFFVTCLALAFISARQERSLMANAKQEAKALPDVTIPDVPVKDATDPAAVVADIVEDAAKVSSNAVTTVENVVERTAPAVENTQK